MLGRNGIQVHLIRLVNLREVGHIRMELQGMIFQHLLMQVAHYQ